MRALDRAYRKLRPLTPSPFIESGAYRGRVELYESLPVTDRVVLVGDSLIDFAPWGELLDGVVNRGIAGDTAEGVMRRLPAILHQSPKQVFVLCGINDLLQGASVDYLVGLFRGIDRSVYVVSILPTFDAELNKRVENVNDHLSQLSDRYVDCYPDFVSNGVIKPALSADGIHLGREGYSVLAKCVGEIIEQVPA